MNNIQSLSDEELQGLINIYESVEQSRNEENDMYNECYDVYKRAVCEQQLREEDSR